MLEQRYRWKNKQLREHVCGYRWKTSTNHIIKKCSIFKSNFSQMDDCEIFGFMKIELYMLATNIPLVSKIAKSLIVLMKLLVPGYIEPHAHPFQLYNPHTLAAYASQFGTTTLINDNMLLFLQI